MTGVVRVVADDNEKRHFTKADMERQLRLAEVNHCLSFEQVSDELIEDYNISDGTFDTVVECRYTVPSFTSIGRLYQGVVLSTMKNDVQHRRYWMSYLPLSVMKYLILIRMCTTQTQTIFAAAIWRAKCLRDRGSVSHFQLLSEERGA